MTTATDMMREQIEKRPESGSTLLEFTFVAVTFFMMLLAITSGANLYFTHNALVEATRRGARFAATQAASNPAGTTTGCTVTNLGPSVTAIRNYAVYGNSAGTGSPLVAGLQPANVNVEYCNFGVGTGAVSVFITGYNYSVVIPFISRQITMPAYRTTVRGESAGTSPTPPCGT
jgi:Flp pilus assembly protein TadG